MKLDKELIGKKIRQMRIEKGFSQEQLSEKIEISPRHMCTIENGNSFPSLETFVNISEILDIDINKFFDIETLKRDRLRSEINDLIQISTPNELRLIKDIIVAVRNNK